MLCQILHFLVSDSTASTYMLLTILGLPHHRQPLVLPYLQTSNHHLLLDLVFSLSLSLNPITCLVSFLPWLILFKILPWSLVFLMDLPMSSHFFWNFNKEMYFPHKLHLYIPTSFPWDWIHTWQTPSVFVDPPKFTAICTCQFPGWTFIVAWHTPDVTHCTCAQWAAYNTLHPHISPPSEP